MAVDLLQSSVAASSSSCASSSGGKLSNTSSLASATTTSVQPLLIRGAKVCLGLNPSTTNLDTVHCEDLTRSSSDLSSLQGLLPKRSVEKDAEEKVACTGGEVSVENFTESFNVAASNLETGQNANRSTARVYAQASKDLQNRFLTLFALVDQNWKRTDEMLNCNVSRFAALADHDRRLAKSMCSLMRGIKAQLDLE